MLQRKDIISVYEQTGSIRATVRETGFNRRTVSAYVHEYLDAKAAGDVAFSLSKAHQKCMLTKRSCS